MLGIPEKYMKSKPFGGNSRVFPSIDRTNIHSPWLPRCTGQNQSFNIMPWAINVKGKLVQIVNILSAEVLGIVNKGLLRDVSALFARPHHCGITYPSHFSQSKLTNPPRSSLSRKFSLPGKLICLFGMTRTLLTWRLVVHAARRLSRCSSISRILSLWPPINDSCSSSDVPCFDELVDSAHLRLSWAWRNSLSAFWERKGRSAFDNWPAVVLVAVLLANFIGWTTALPIDWIAPSDLSTVFPGRNRFFWTSWLLLKAGSFFMLSRRSSSSSDSSSSAAPSNLKSFFVFSLVRRVRPESRFLFDGPIIFSVLPTSLGEACPSSCALVVSGALTRGAPNALVSCSAWSDIWKVLWE